MADLFNEPAFWMLLLFLGPLLCSVPISVSLGCAACFLLWKWDLGIMMLSYNFYAGIYKFPLLAIPFFILAGVIMEKAGIAERIIRLINELVGSVTGGLAIATVAVATFWGAVSGSGPATVAALGLVLIPGMVKAGYDKAFATSVVSVSSGLAIIIPPSIIFIVYCDIMPQVSIGALFAAGILPGIVVALALMIVVRLLSARAGYRGTPRTPGELGRAFRNAFWGLVTPLIILGGIYGGVFTPTEAAAVAVFYGLFIGFFIYRTLTLKILLDILISSLQGSAVVMFVVTCAGLYSWVGDTIGFIPKIGNILLNISDNPWVVLLTINVMLFFAGMILEAIAIMYVFMPVLLPVVAHFGWDPLWFGVVATVNMAIGQVTPPVAVNLFVGANISGLRIEEIAKPAIPQVAAVIVALALISLFPAISTFIPKMMGMY
ncbi:MAG: TRAP transporter large permease [Synergistaceae bacterium]|jgi:C4-dicarboxylate transporter DctM subunit|nr:TRAP transporter large permease [Synergistaceae bacterium]